MRKKNSTRAGYLARRAKMTPMTTLPHITINTGHVAYVRRDSKEGDI